MIKGRLLFLYHTDQRSSGDTARCPCARIFPFIPAVLTPLRALQPLFPVHKGWGKPRVVLGRPKLIPGHSAGSQLMSRELQDPLGGTFSARVPAGGLQPFQHSKDSHRVLGIFPLTEA